MSAMTIDWQNWMRDVCAFRYALGRQTYVVSMCAEDLARSWSDLHPRAQQIIERDLREAIQRDAESRNGGSTYHPLGDDCDRAAWLGLVEVIDKAREASQ